MIGDEEVKDLDGIFLRHDASEDDTEEGVEKTTKQIAAVGFGGRTIQDAVDVLRHVLRQREASTGEDHCTTAREDASETTPPASNPISNPLLSSDLTVLDIHLIGPKQQPPASHLQRSAVYVVR